MSDPLRPLWDFDDLDATEARFRALRAEALTQLARVQGLREDYDARRPAAGRGGRGRSARPRSASTSSAAGCAARPATRRRRCRSSSARSRRPSRRARTGSPATRRTWPRSRRPTATASSRGRTAGSSWPSGREAAAYWAGPLLNNLGWEHFDAEEYEQALAAFERALAVRERDPDNPAAIEHAREAVAEARKALGRD